MAFTPSEQYMICASASGSSALINVEVDGSGDYSAPKFAYKPYSKQVTNGAGVVMGQGWATADWIFEIITQKQRDWLRTFIPGQSAEVWIKTRTFDSNRSYAIFKAIAVWPVVSEEQDANRRMKFTLHFQRLQSS
jgi:hypothetical protein